MIVKLNRREIDSNAWDSLVDHSVTAIPYTYSWLLDEVSPNWFALIDLDERDNSYRAGIAIPTIKKYGITYISQSPYTFQLGIIHREEAYSDIQLLKSFFGSQRIISEYRFAHIIQKDSLPSRIFHTSIDNLIVEKPITKVQYNQNRKRDLKKFYKSNSTIDYGIRPEILLDLFFDYTAQKIYGMSKLQYPQLLRVFSLFQQHLNIHTLGVKYKEEYVGAAFVLIYRKTAYYQMAAFAPIAYEIGGATGLIDAFINKFDGQLDKISFNSSQQLGVDRFYRSFGAVDSPYSKIRQINLPPFLENIVDLRRLLEKK